MGTGKPILEDSIVANNAVSIQLMSPASGNGPTTVEEAKSVMAVSIQLMSPASGNCMEERDVKIAQLEFPFN